MKFSIGKINQFNTINGVQTSKTPEKNKGVNFGNQYVTNTQLPSIHSAGMSQVNTNVPISYTKLGEIPIPNLENNASLFQLANGQRVIILPKKGPTQIKTTFNVGSLNETEDLRGMSHYIEHNLFNGSKGLAPKEYDKKVSNMGGYTNASTSFCKTDYYLTIQLLEDSFLEEGIKLNAAQTQYPSFPVEQLEKEKEPVKSEIDLYKDEISDVSSSRMLKNLFGINTVSTNFILGTKQNINSFTREKVMDYYNTWYTPDNAVTVITGDVDVNETIALVSKYFNKPADYSQISKRHTEPFTFPTQPIRNDIIQKGSPFSNISMGFAIPANTSQRELAAIDLLTEFLASPNSEFMQALDKYGITPEFYRENMQNSPNGVQALYTTLNLPEEQVEEVLNILYTEIHKIANNPPDIQEFRNVQNSFLETFEKLGEYSEGVNAVLTNIAMMNDYNYLQNKKYNIATLTPAEISAAAKKFMDLNKVSLCVAHTDKTTAEAINQNYNAINQKQSQVSFGKSNPITNIQNDLSKVREFKLWNNIETRIIPAKPNGDCTFLMDIQTDTIKNASAPAIEILTELLNRGSASRGVEGYYKLLSQNNISLYFSAGSSGLSIAGVFKDAKMQDTLALMKETLSMPNFSQAEFERAKANLKDSLINSQTSAIELSFKELFPDIKVFDTTKEQLEEIDKLTLTDIQNLYNQLFVNAQCEATCTIPVEQKPYLQDMFNQTLSTGMPQFKPAVINRELSTSTYKPITEAKTVTAAEENAQAEIIQTYTFKTTNNIDDGIKISLLNSILGEGMSSRLFTDLREKEKLAYRVRSEELYQNDTGIINLQISTTTDPETVGEGSPENAKKAIEGFNRNVHLLKTQLVSEEELQQAKNKLKTSILDSRESNSDVTTQMHANRNSAYGLKHVQEVYEAIDKITVLDIMAAANYVFANPAITSIVASQKTLDALNL